MREKKPNRYYVYVHYDADDKVGYVGKGSGNRAFEFGRRSYKWNKRFTTEPRVEIVKKGMTEGEAYRFETDLIQSYFDKGIEIANLLIGNCLFDESGLKKLRDHFSTIRSGKGHWSYGKARPEETRRKISETKLTKPGSAAKPWLGKKRDPEFMARITAASHTPEAIAKRSAKMRGRTLSEDHKAKISEAGKGRVHSEQTKANISAAKKGKPNGLEGTKHSDERKAKQSEIMKERMKDPALREAIMNRKKGWTTKKAKAVLCVELEKIFRCAKDAALEIGCSDKHIQACCTGRRERHHGYHWQYVT